MLKSVISVRTFFIHFRLVLQFQLDMGDLLVELKLGGGSGGGMGGGGSSLKRWRQFKFKLWLCFSNDSQGFIAKIMITRDDDYFLHLNDR